MELKNIHEALAPYHPKYRMVRSAQYQSKTKNLEAEVFFPPYPFTTEPLKYASLQLLSLAAQQVVLVHLRQEAEHSDMFRPTETLDTMMPEWPPVAGW